MRRDRTGMFGELADTIPQRLPPRHPAHSACHVELEVPAIAAVNGPAIGAGCDLTCVCDIRIASTKAQFAESFAKIGIIPATAVPGCSAWSACRAPAVAFYRRTDRRGPALAWGLVRAGREGLNSCWTAPTGTTHRCRQPAQAVRMSKRLLREGRMRLDSLLELSASMQALAHHTPGPCGGRGCTAGKAFRNLYQLA